MIELVQRVSKFFKQWSDFDFLRPQDRLNVDIRSFPVVKFPSIAGWDVVAV